MYHELLHIQLLSILLEIFQPIPVMNMQMIFGQVHSVLLHCHKNHYQAHRARKLHAK